MGQVISFNSERNVSLVEESLGECGPKDIRIKTISSGISAGTELTAYRGTNPYLHKHWDAKSRLFRNAPPNFEYPLIGWGYSEVGTVVEVGSDVDHLNLGDIVWGIWGHRSEAIVNSEKLIGHKLDKQVQPDAGTFGRVGAIALNAVLAAELSSGDTMAIFGQGVIGLLCTNIAVAQGIKVIAIDFDASRLEWAKKLGAVQTLNPSQAGIDGVAGDLRTSEFPEGLPAAIEISGSYKALHEAIRTVKPGGIVVGSGFYQGDGVGLRLGEEFHHNRVRLLSSQIGGVPVALSSSMSVEDLHLNFMKMVQAGELDPVQLISHKFPANKVSEAFELLDTSSDVLQVVLSFEEMKIK